MINDEPLLTRINDLEMSARDAEHDREDMACQLKERDERIAALESVLAKGEQQAKYEYAKWLAIVYLLKGMLYILSKLYFDRGDSHSAESLIDDIRKHILYIKRICGYKNEN
jgi:septal ring factor EnvC (AmiA/AmiB activator)